MSNKTPNPKNIGIYDYNKRIKRTLNLINKELSEENIKLITQYPIVMITESLSKATQHRNWVLKLFFWQRLYLKNKIKRENRTSFKN